MMTPEDSYCRVTVSLLKRHLLEEMAPTTRRWFINRIELFAADIGADLVAGIEPMCDQAFALMNSREPDESAVELFVERFTAFAALNPSLIRSGTA